jgi:hypothetical protein
MFTYLGVLPVWERVTLDMFSKANGSSVGVNGYAETSAGTKRSSEQRQQHARRGMLTAGRRPLRGVRFSEAHPPKIGLLICLLPFYSPGIIDFRGRFGATQRTLKPYLAVPAKHCLFFTSLLLPDAAMAICLMLAVQITAEKYNNV